MIDQVDGRYEGLPIFLEDGSLEDGAKLSGIAFWQAAVALLAVRTLAATARPAGTARTERPLTPE